MAKATRASHDRRHAGKGTARLGSATTRGAASRDGPRHGRRCHRTDAAPLEEQPGWSIPSGLFRARCPCPTYPNARFWRVYWSELLRILAPARVVYRVHGERERCRPRTQGRTTKEPDDASRSPASIRDHAPAPTSTHTASTRPARTRRNAHGGPSRHERASRADRSPHFAGCAGYRAGCPLRRHARAPVIRASRCAGARPPCPPR